MKKQCCRWTAAVLAAVMLLAASVTARAEALPGDANGDGNVDMKDVLTVRKFIAGLTDTIDLAAADKNGDGEVNMKDVLAIRREIAHSVPDDEPEGGVYVLLSSVRYDENETPFMRSEHIYDKRGRMLTLIGYDENGELLSRWDYTYDQNDHCIRGRAIGADGAVQWADSWDAVYDENGHVVCEIYYDKDETPFRIEKDVGEDGLVQEKQYYDTNGDLTERYVYAYDTYGNCIRVRHFDANGEALWWDAYDITYNENGDILSMRYYKEDGSVDWRICTDVTYNENGDFLSERCYKEDGSVDWSGCTDTAYNENGDPVSVQRYQEDGTAYIATEYIYDETGHHVQSIGYRPDHSVEYCTNISYTDEEITEDSIKYNEEGQMSGRVWQVSDHDDNTLSLRHYMWDGTDWVVNWKESEDYEYDAARHPTAEFGYDADGNKLCRWTATYNARGNCTATISYNSDGSPNWERSWSALYDGSGNCLSLFHYNADGTVREHIESRYAAFPQIITPLFPGIQAAG